MRRSSAIRGFSKKFRLTGNFAYRHVLQRAPFKSGNHISAYYVENQLENPRLGIVVSKRVNKKAVVRNALKRLVRESFRLGRSELRNLDIVIIMRNPIDLTQRDTLNKHLDIVWKRLSFTPKN